MNFLTEVNYDEFKIRTFLNGGLLTILVMFSCFGWAFPSSSDTLPEDQLVLTSTKAISPGSSQIQLPVEIVLPGHVGYLVCAGTETIWTVPQPSVSFIGGTISGGESRFYNNSGRDNGILNFEGITHASGFNIISCAVWSDEVARYLSKTTRLVGTFNLSPKPTITVSPPLVKLSSCYEGSNNEMSANFLIHTAWEIVPNYEDMTIIPTAATLSAFIVKDALSNGSGLKILDDNNNDILTNESNILTSAEGNYSFTAKVKCPAIAGEYEWVVSLTYNIE
jgi:hypothetical protein